MSVTAPTASEARPFGAGVRFLAAPARAATRLLTSITLTCALTILAITALLVFELYTNSALPRQKFGWSFLVTRPGIPVTGQFGALPFIYGTVVTSALALIMGVPLGWARRSFWPSSPPPRFPTGSPF